MSVSPMSAEMNPIIPTIRRGPAIAVIADVVRSRRFTGAARRRLQERLVAVLDGSNVSYQASILSRFIITTGDEFQGLLHRAAILPDLLWDLEREFGDADFRIGIGCGEVETALRAYALGMDGPVWHRARKAIETARSTRREGGVFLGFGHEEDLVLNGFARLLRYIRERLTDNQRQLLDLLRSGRSQSEAAELLEITRQAVSQQAQSAGWEAYRDGESGWRTMLERFDFSDAWVLG